MRVALLNLVETALRVAKQALGNRAGKPDLAGLAREAHIVAHCIRLCRFSTLRLISRISHAPAKVVDGRFQQHFTELKPPTPRTHGSAERALDA
jgi:hypothetical protein